MPPVKKPKVSYRGSYANYAAEERASIGHYSSQHGPMAASWYLTKNLLVPYVKCYWKWYWAVVKFKPPNAYIFQIANIFSSINYNYVYINNLPWDY